MRCSTNQLCSDIIKRPAFHVSADCVFLLSLNRKENCLTSLSIQIGLLINLDEYSISIFVPLHWWFNCFSYFCIPSKNKENKKSLSSNSTLMWHLPTLRCLIRYFFFYSSSTNSNSVLSVLFLWTPCCSHGEIVYYYYTNMQNDSDLQ